MSFQRHLLGRHPWSAGSTRLLNVTLRLTTLAVRFLFIFFLARYLDPASVGYYGLFTAAVTYAFYIVGLDFNVFVTREIIGTPKDQRGRLLKGQAALAALMYLGLFPVAAIFLWQMSWPPELLWWFIPILILEHLNQEIARILVALSEQIMASVLLFVRQGSWAIAIVLLMVFEPGSRDLGSVMIAWAAGGLSAVFLGLLKLKSMNFGGWNMTVDWPWIRKGIVVSGSFLVATLALRAVQTVDRYWLEAIGGIETVGAYVLFMGVTGSLLVFLDASLFSYTYPELIRLNHRKEYATIRAKVLRLLVQTLAVCAAFSVVSWYMLPFLLNWIGNPLYSENLYLYPWIMVATILQAISMVPHYALYARGRDTAIIYSHVAALPAFILATWIAGRSQGLLAVPIGLSIAYLLILLWKTIATWKKY